MNAPLLIAGGVDLYSRILVPAFHALFEDVEEHPLELRSPDQLLAEHSSSVAAVVTRSMIEDSDSGSGLDSLEAALRERADIRVVACTFQVDDLRAFSRYPLSVAAMLRKPPIVLLEKYCLSRAANKILDTLARPATSTIVLQVRRDSEQDIIAKGAMLFLRSLASKALQDHRRPENFLPPQTGEPRNTVSDAARAQFSWAYHKMQSLDSGKRTAVASRCLNTIVRFADGRYRVSLCEHFDDARNAGFADHEIVEALYEEVMKCETEGDSYLSRSPTHTNSHNHGPILQSEEGVAMLGEQAYTSILAKHPEYKEHFSGTTIWIEPVSGQHVVESGIGGLEKLLAVVGREKAERIYSRPIGDELMMLPMRPEEFQGNEHVGPDI